MTRRGLFGAMLALAVRPVRKTYGLMTYERWKAEGFLDRGARVHLNGVDVTDMINAFNDEEEWVQHLRGHHAKKGGGLDDGRPINIRLRGKVEVVG